MVRQHIDPSNDGIATSGLKVIQMFSIVKMLTQASAKRAREAAHPAEQVAAGPEGPESKDFYPSRSHASTLGTVTHRDLFAVILRDTLRMYGIPLEWVNVEVLNTSKDSNAFRLQINFVIHHWHEGLLMYAPALQKQFLQTLRDFDPITDHSRHSVCWKFSPKCESPLTEIPGPSYWAVPLNQFEDAMSAPITLPPTAQQPIQPRRAFTQEISGATGGASVPQPAIDRSGIANIEFRFDLPPRGLEREHVGDFPSTIPLRIE